MSHSDGAADLHMHTPASDGTIGVDQRVTIAADRGLETIAITDHDVIDEWFETRSTTQQNVQVITGVEVRADLFDTKIEILGYFVDPNDPKLQTMLERARSFRIERNRKLVKNLSAFADLDLCYEALNAEVEGNLGRPHLAEVLIERGVVDSIGEAFEQYLAKEGEAFVPMERLGYKEVVETIHGSGGVCSLAHPGRIRSDTSTVEQMVETLANAGLDGIEVWYPYGSETSDEYADITEEDAAALAERYDLLKTGGSDCHGPKSGNFRLGEVQIPADALAALEEHAA
ncbi:PHP domain-containing protein [Halobellus sp. EA9]|uniref:PHP domain-containing protein n=1 Tax=Halobellus sp. EA9 TaxID=3421647 RepID=UPI003EBA0197